MGSLNWPLVNILVQKWWSALTHDLDLHGAFVLHVLDLHGQRVLPGVLPLSRADEQDGVHFACAHVNCLSVQGLAIFGPSHAGPGFSLFKEGGWGVKISTLEEISSSACSLRQQM